MRIPIVDGRAPRRIKTPMAPSGKNPRKKPNTEFVRPERSAKPVPAPPPAKKRKPRPVPESTSNVPATVQEHSAPVVKGKAPKISKTDLSNMQSIIGDKVEDIQALLADGKFESATNQMHTVLLQTLVDIIPYAEEAIRNSKGTKGVYQINSLAAMILETLNSARSQSDRGQLAHHLVERVLQPAFKLFAEALVREFMALDADISMAKPDQVQQILRDTRGRLANSLQQTYENMRNDTLKFLGG